MPEDKDKDKAPPSWQHGRDVGLGSLRESLEVVKDGVERAIAESEAELRRLVAARKRMIGR